MIRNWLGFFIVALAACSGKTESSALDGGTMGGQSNLGGFGGEPLFGGFGGEPLFGGSGGTGGPSFGGSPGGGGFGASLGRVGRACAVDAECGDGLFCAKATSLLFAGESPGKGYCTTECTSTPEICNQVDDTATCFSFDNVTAFCLETCVPGPDGLSQFDPDKCHGRQEVACSPMLPALTSAICLPQCNTDSDCGGGQACNPKTGLCTTTTAAGLSIGSSCDPFADACKGSCEELETTLPGIPVAACTQKCTLGAYPSCDWLGPGTGPAPAACLYASPGVAALGGPGIGDLGYCGRLCNCDDECLAEYECIPWSGPDAPSFEAFFQRTGYCGVNPEPGDAAVTPCN